MLRTPYTTPTGSSRLNKKFQTKYVPGGAERYMLVVSRVYSVPFTQLSSSALGLIIDLGRYIHVFYSNGLTPV
jgi:hypothetical protein